MEKISIFWFRRDLRMEDNAGFFHALNSGYPVLPVFIFDTDILDKLEDPEDKRVEFIHSSLKDLKSELEKYQSSLLIEIGRPLEVFKHLQEKYSISAVYTNHDYEPYAIRRDLEVEVMLKKHGVEFYSFKDQVIFEKEEILKENGTPYTVFTPYSKKWKSALSDFYLKSYPCQKHLNQLHKTRPLSMQPPEQIGFTFKGLKFPVREVSDEILKNYHLQRNYPGIEGTTRLSVHLRFGTISIRQLAARARNLDETYLNELIWREFFMMILYHFPLVENSCFKSEYQNFKWRNNEEEFERWMSGTTGYPIVDAGMRELNETGYMHNRVRLIAASFLCKHLLIDWRWGEAYFAKKLLDYDLAPNNGNWQWAAGCGCDAAPFFRIFNPYLQTEKFDKNLKYIRKWVPEFQEFSYPRPIVEHEFARKRALEAMRK